MCHLLMINFLVIMKKVVCTLGSITFQDKKIKSKNYQLLCVRRLINILVLFLLRHLNWIERYSTMKIGRFVFCLSICLVLVMLSCLFIAGQGLTSWLSSVVFNCVFTTSSCGILGRVWFFIVSIRDLCRLSYLYYLTVCMPLIV